MSRALLVMMLLTHVAFGQVNRYMVFFKDKSGSTFDVGHPEQFLSQRSIDRRLKQEIPFSTEDLPVNVSYVNLVNAKAGETFFTSRWMNGVLAEIDSDSVDLIRALTFVDHVELVAPGNRFSGGRAGRSKGKSEENYATAIMSLPQIHQLEADEMHQDGFHGEGKLIAVMDGGFASVDVASPFQSLFQRNAIRETYNFVNRSSQVYENCSGCSHGTEVLSTIAVNTADFTGTAYGSDFLLYVTEDDPTEYRIEEYNWIFAAEKADSAGVDVISTSLGYNEFDDPSMNYTTSQLDGKTAAISIGANIAGSKGIVVVVSAGNSGNSSWHFITSPADAQRVIAVGAVTIEGAHAVFSSYGPTADGRIKPDVVALGSSTSVILPNGTVGSNSGTSFACPLVAGFAAGVWQAYPNLTADKLMDLVRRSGDRASSPDNTFGYGIPKYKSFKNLIESTGTITVYPNPYNANNLPSPTDRNKVHINFPYGTGDTSISVIDLMGRSVLQESFTLEGADIVIAVDISGVPSGMYLIQIKTKLGTQTVRFVKA